MTEPHEPHAPTSDLPASDPVATDASVAGASPPHELHEGRHPDPLPPDPLPPDPLPHGMAGTGANEADAPVLEAIRAPGAEPVGMATPTRPARARRDPLPLLFGVGIIILIGAVVYLWRHPISEWIANAAPDEHVVALQQQVAGLQQQMTGLQQRLTGVEQRPIPAPANLSPLEQRLATLEQNVSALEKRPVAAPPSGASGPMIDQSARDQVAALATKFDALASKFDPLAGKFDGLANKFDPLANKVDALAKQQAQTAAQQTQLAAQQTQMVSQQTQIASSESATTAALAARIDADQQRIAALAAQSGQIAAVSGRLDAEDQRVGALATEAGKINGVAERAARVARIQAATAALEAGHPLGDLPDAQGPQAAALVRFRTEAPPTEAALRLAFPAAAAAAQQASRPDTAQMPFWQSVQSRAQELVTVRRGDDVVVGDPATGVISRARHLLDAGDLAGAVTVLSELTGKPAEAFADWLQRAKALLDARAALAALAARA